MEGEGWKKKEKKQRSVEEEVENVSGTIGCFCCVFLLVIAPASISVYVVVYTTSSPCLLSNLQSFSINNNKNNSSTALCDVVLSLRKDPPSYENLMLDMAMASVYYRGDRIWSQLIPPFGLPQREEIHVLRFNLTAWLPDWAAQDFRYGRVLAFDFKLEGIGSGYSHGLLTKTKDDGFLLKLWCAHFKAAYSSPSAAIHLIHGPHKCHAHIDYHPTN